MVEMADMRVRLVLDFVNRSKGGADKAKRDLKEVRSAAQSLNGVRAGDRIARDLKLTADQARAAQTAIGRARAEMQAMGRTNVRPQGLSAMTATLAGGRNRKASKDQKAPAGAGASLPLLLAGGAGTIAGLSGAYLLAAGLRKGTDEALALEKALYQVEKATDTDAAGMAAYRAQTVALSIATGKSAEEIAGITAAAGFAGRPIKDLARFTAYAAKATVAWNMGSEETGQSLAEIGNIYQATQTQIEAIGDAVNKAADISAAKESDLLNILNRASSLGRQIGLGANGILALGAALKEVGTPAEVAGTALNALFTNISLGDGATKEFAEGLKVLKTDSKKLQAAVRKDAMGAIVGLLERIEKVPDGLKRMEVLKQLFGREYADNIGALLNNLGRLKEVMATLNDQKQVTGSVARDFDKRLKTDFSKLERAQQSMNELYRRLGDPLKIAAGSVAEGVNKILAAYDQLSAAKAKIEEVSQKLADGKPLAPGEADIAASNPDKVAEAIEKTRREQARTDGNDTRASISRLPEDQQGRERLRLIRRQIERELSGLAKELELIGPDGQGRRRKLMRRADLQRQLDQLPPVDDIRETPRGPADFDDRQRASAAETKARVDKESELRRLKRLRDLAPGESAKAFADRIQELEGGNARGEGGLSRVRPNMEFVPKKPDSKAKAKGKQAEAPDLSAIKSAYSIDLQPEGRLIAESLATGISSGGAGAKAAADGVNQVVRSAFDGGDLTSAGTALMASLASGIRAGGNQAVAAAQEVAGRVRQAAANVGGSGASKTISGALHDGVV
jgi:TP901 family phage tail tape measure protein